MSHYQIAGMTLSGFLFAFISITRYYTSNHKLLLPLHRLIAIRLAVKRYVLDCTSLQPTRSPSKFEHIWQPLPSLKFRCNSV